MKLSELTQAERTACFRLIGTILGRLPDAIPNPLSPERSAVDLLLLELENELAASRPSGNGELRGANRDADRGGPDVLVHETGPFAWMLRHLRGGGHGGR